MSVFQNALTLAPSYLSSFLQPNLGATNIQPNSAYTEFVGQASRLGYQISNRFIVMFENPWLDEKIQFVRRKLDTRLSLQCYTANIPTRYFSTHERNIAGPKRFIPYTTTYDELSLQFYCSQDMFELNLFQGWMDGILNPVTRYAAYYDDYAKDSKITLLFVPNNVGKMEDLMSAYSNKTISGIRFLEAYPRAMSINGGPVEWAPKTQPLLMNVTFGTREFVNLRTYDQEVQRQLERLNQSDLTNGLDDLLSRSQGQNAAFNGSVSLGEFQSEEDPLFVNPYADQEALEEKKRQEDQDFWRRHERIMAMGTERDKNVASNGAVITKDMDNGGFFQRG